MFVCFFCLYVRRDPPIVELMEKVRSALGDNVKHLKNMMMTPIYRNKTVNVRRPQDVLMQYKQLLPVENAELDLNKHNSAAMTRLLQKLCSDTTVPQANREFISLVVASFNMHTFGLPQMSISVGKFDSFY